MDLSYAPLDNLNDYDFTAKTNNLRLQSTLTYNFTKSIALSLSYKNETIDELRSDHGYERRIDTIMRKQFGRTRRSVVENDLDLPVIRSVEKTPDERSSIRIA